MSQILTCFLMTSVSAPVFSAMIGIMLCTGFPKVRKKHSRMHVRRRRTHRCVNVSWAVSVDGDSVLSKLSGCSQIRATMRNLPGLVAMGVLSYQQTGSSRGQQTSLRNMLRKPGRLWTIHRIRFGYDSSCCDGPFLPAIEHAPALHLSLGVQGKKNASYQ